MPVLAIPSLINTAVLPQNDTASITPDQDGKELSRNRPREYNFPIVLSRAKRQRSGVCGSKTPVEINPFDRCPKK
jgi:hypothetical protein